MKLTAVFEEDKDQGGYSVTIPALPGCISEGNTFEEAVKNIEEAAALYLEGIEQRHEDFPHDNDIIIAPIHVAA